MPDKLLHAIQQARVVGVLRTDSSNGAVQAALAAVRGGLQMLELTFTTPNVERAIAQLRQQLPPEVLLGVGTVTSRQQMHQALKAGAMFLVSPHYSPALLEEAQAQNAFYIPGVLTPSEMMAATQQGASTLKFFPAESAGGAKLIKDILAPFPDLKLMATGGIQPKQTQAYLEAGAVAVGLGSQLFPKAAIVAQDWQAVENATREALIQAGVAEVGIAHG